jgi:hypothetical protein
MEGSGSGVIKTNTVPDPRGQKHTDPEHCSLKLLSLYQDRSYGVRRYLLQGCGSVFIINRKEPDPLIEFLKMFKFIYSGSKFNIFAKNSYRKSFLYI